MGTPHCGIVVDTGTPSAWLSSGTATTYTASTLHTFLSNTVLTNIKSDFTTLFGSSNHLLGWSILDNGVGTYNWTSSTQYITVMIEVQFYGSKIWSGDNYHQGEGVKPLQLFQKYKFNEIYGQNHIWLRSLYSSSHACNADSGGFADYTSLSSTA